MSTFTKDAMINDSEKDFAFTVYKESVTMLGNKNFCYRDSDSCIALYNVFRSFWCMNHPSTQQGRVDIEVFAGAYRAFNYANMALGTRGRFVALAETLIPEADRRDRKTLVEMSRDMNSIIRPNRPARRKTAA